jgi:hypothetical protein
MADLLLVMHQLVLSVICSRNAQASEARAEYVGLLRKEATMPLLGWPGSLVVDPPADQQRSVYSTASSYLIFILLLLHYLTRLTFSSS